MKQLANPMAVRNPFVDARAAGVRANRAAFALVGAAVGIIVLNSVFGDKIVKLIPTGVPPAPKRQVAAQNAPNVGFRLLKSDGKVETIQLYDLKTGKPLGTTTAAVDK